MNATDLSPELVDLMAKAADRHFDAIMAAEGYACPAWEAASAEYRRDAAASMSAALSALLASGYRIVRAS